MKKKELTALREKTVVELEKIVAEKRLGDKSKKTRREIAQILTMIGEVKLNENINR